MKKKLIGILAVISIFTCMLVEVSAKTAEKTEEIANWTFDEETITYFKDSTTYPRVGKANYSGDNSLVDGYEGKGLAVNGAASSSQRSSEYYCFGTRVKTGNYRFTAKYKPGTILDSI